MASRQPSAATPHTAFKRLPVVDVSGLASSAAAERQAAARVLGEAARQAGFLYVTGHGIEPRLIERLIARTRQYFAQPLEQKMRDYIGNSTNHSGYVPEGEEQFYPGVIDHKEAYDIGYDYRSAEGRRPMLGPNQWADMPGFQEDIKAYYEAALALGNRLFRGFALALGLPEDAFSRHLTTPPSQLRLIHYPLSSNVTADRPGVGAHTDYECFTILLPTAPGLEVLNGAGEWIDVPVLEGAFVINIGDMLEVLSNGTYVATSHRVRKVAEERYSFPLFCTCDYDTLIEPIKSLLSEANPPRYQPIRCGDHLFAQTAQTFGYLKKRIEAGDVALPEGARGLSSFGHQAATTGERA
ncbi:MAG TPA: isopenicillin N synthase family oxygenase [Pseudomonas xinjiangensis]|uniref:Isopenicillin N synthase family oxygenase n=2 Tax=root TaxID=1 RepID=A0A7V1BPB1_9GAMM|nr:isopenicillin N synthase family oxygenase [Halopseudomonas xinjiangensis]HEC47344.1 isopenicillin N synthase family oxygenase [Halopseudomonas xinjiangensis]